MNADRGVELEESLNYIKTAVSLDPTNGAYLDSLGWAYFKLGKYDLAEENLNKASLHMGSDPTVQDHLGDLYQKTGRLKLAAAHWERAVEEWNKTIAPEQDADLFAATQKKLDAAKVRLAKEGSGTSKRRILNRRAVLKTIKLVAFCLSIAILGCVQVASAAAAKSTGARSRARADRRCPEGIHFQCRRRKP